MFAESEIGVTIIPLAGLARRIVNLFEVPGKRLAGPTTSISEVFGMNSKQLTSKCS